MSKRDAPESCPACGQALPQERAPKKETLREYSERKTKEEKPLTCHWLTD